MHTLFVEHSALPGGGQLGLARFLASEAGADSAVAVLGPGTAFDGLPPERVTRLGDARSRFGLLRSALRLRRFIKASGAQVVVANSPRAGAVLAGIPRVKGVTYIYYLRVDVNRTKTSALHASLLTRWILPRFHGYISNSAWTDSTIPASVAGRPRRIAYPVSGTTELISLPPARGRGDQPFTVLSLSRVVPWKGVHVLVEAVSILNDQGLRDRLRAVVAGGTFHEDESYGRELMAHARAAAPNLSFIGHSDDVPGLLAEADVLVSCTLVEEPFGQVVAQGLAAGRPVIATGLGGPLEMITDGRNGLLVQPDDAEALAAAIRDVLEDPVRAEEMGAAARVSAADFADDRTTHDLAVAVRELRAESVAASRGARSSRSRRKGALTWR
jgi:glycosyltransferase involved in cell wall biosynthesis